MGTPIELDPKTAMALADLAASSGLTVPAYLQKHFAPLHESDAVDDADRWLDELTEGLPELPPLPQDFSTKDVYAEHD